MTAPDPGEVDRLIASDPAVVRLLAAYVEGVTNPKPTPSPKPAPEPATPKATANPKRKGPTMPRRPREPKKERGRVTVLLSDVPSPVTTWIEQERVRKLMVPQRTATDAHDVELVTPCSTCGGPVERTEADWFGPWRRHPACARIVSFAPSRVAVAARSLGIAEVDDATAARTSYRVPLYAEGHPEPTWLDTDRKRDRGAWLHVDRKALLSSLSEATTETEELSIERPCEAGRCAWCGRAEALDWWAHGHQWRDGSEAPLCGDCAAVYERRGRPAPNYPDDARPALAEAITGVPVMLGEQPPPGLRAYVEAEGAGDGSPWSHLPAAAVEAFKIAAWGRYGGRYAPPEHRAEAVARARAADVERAAGIAARVADADVYGFTKE